MLSIETTSSGAKMEVSLNNLRRMQIDALLNRYGKLGVDALSKATPIETGLTASSWSYRIEKSRGRYSLIWSNSHVVEGVPIAIILQYGHGTGTGGWVQGRDYINPAIQPLFDRITEEIWKEVKNA